MSAAQMINLAYVLLAKQPALQFDLRSWLRRPVADKTWTNMLTHFREAVFDLRSLPTAGDAYHHQHHQANMAVMADLVAQRILDAQLEYADSLPAPVAPALPVPLPALPMPPQANAVLDPSIQALQTMMQQLLAHHPAPAPAPAPSTRSRGRGGRHHSSRPGPRRQQTAAPRQYCWTHGACAHSGSQCSNPADGHVATATFQNRAGGSAQNCFWLT